MSDITPLRHRPRRRLDDARLAFRIAKSAIVDPFRPLIANLIVTRRCNLACGYCSEYDKTSAPVPLEVLKERIDHFARLRAVFVTLTGGESLLVPHLAEVVAHVRARGMVPNVNTNGYLLTRKWIEKLDAAGLYGMQISIDNVTPNDVTAKSLKVLQPKLRLLARHAKFRVRINTVLGAAPPAEAVQVAATAIALGLDASTSLLRNGSGETAELDDVTSAAYAEIRALGRRAHPLLADDFQIALANGEEADWKCRAGARTIHVCEDGLVHLCAPRAGSPGTPLAEYTALDIKRAFYMPKPCAKTCPVAYAHHVSRLDQWRSQRGEPLVLPPPPTAIAPDGKRHLPVLAA
jgi:MoaA/NifB/PqqE/SkfB family radical SAM enzyme